MVIHSSRLEHQCANNLRLVRTSMHRRLASYGAHTLTSVDFFFGYVINDYSRATYADNRVEGFHGRTY